MGGRIIPAQRLLYQCLLHRLKTKSLEKGPQVGDDDAPPIDSALVEYRCAPALTGKTVSRRTTPADDTATRPGSQVVHFKARRKELSGPIWGTEKQLCKILVEYEARAELQQRERELLEAREWDRLAALLQEAPLTSRTPVERPSPQEVTLRGMTHQPPRA